MPQARLHRLHGAQEQRLQLHRRDRARHEPAPRRRRRHRQEQGHQLHQDDNGRARRDPRQQRPGKGRRAHRRGPEPGHRQRGRLRHHQPRRLRHLPKARHTLPLHRGPHLPDHGDQHDGQGRPAAHHRELRPHLERPAKRQLRQGARHKDRRHRRPGKFAPFQISRRRDRHQRLQQRLLQRHLRCQDLRARNHFHPALHHRPDPHGGADRQEPRDRNVHRKKTTAPQINTHRLRRRPSGRRLF